MNGGTLKAKIQFLEYTSVPDGAGGFETENAPVIKLETFCSIKQIKASRTAENFQEAINPVYQIKLRMRAGFNPQINYTVKWIDQEYNITSIEEDTVKNKEWTIAIVKRGPGL